MPKDWESRYTRRRETVNSYCATFLVILEMKARLKPRALDLVPDNCQLHTIACIFVIVIAQVPGIYGSKQRESEGVAQGGGLFTT